MMKCINTLTEQGPHRKKNEDAIRHGVNDKLPIHWMIVADGMGGHKAGEVASSLLTDCVAEQLNTLSEVPKQGWKSYACEILKQANSNIYEKSQQFSHYKGMGTTGVLLILEQNCCYIAWVGDSRAYIYHKGELIQLTEDHTMIQFLLNKGAISAATAANSNTKNLLSRALGSKADVEVDIVSRELYPGDRLMLSTDGLHDFLSEDEIKDYLGKYIKLDEKNALCRKMVEHAVLQSSKDNLTLGLICL